MVDLVGTATDILQSLGTNGLLVGILFVVVVLFLYKAITLLTQLLFAAVAGVAFPFLANAFLGLNIPITLDSIVFFAASAVILLFGLHVLSLIYRIAKDIMKF